MSGDQAAIFAVTISMIGLAPPAAGTFAVLAFGVACASWILSWSTSPLMNMQAGLGAEGIL